jgi:DNA transformation protein and related proteins
MSTAPVLLETVMEFLSGLGNLRTRKMFGGVYIYCDDLFIATVHDNTLYFKANQNSAGEFIAKGLKPFSYPTNAGIVTLQYYEAPPEALKSAAKMQVWASKALLAAKQDAERKPSKKTRR